MGKTKKTRKTILDTAATVLSNNQAASMVDIAEASGIGRATLHRYFPTREDLLRELTLDAINQIDHATANISFDQLSGPDALRQILEATVPIGDRFHFLFVETTVQSDPEIARLLEKQHIELRGLVEALKAEGMVAADLPTAWAINAIDALIYAAWESVHHGYIARRDAAGLVYRTLIQGLSSE